ncbi:stress responsive A/B barrel domain-containing protein [Pyricularia oryzae]|nr:stress responsive A/B barrel domain-containing protein [Pyricularia oryzae]
MTIKHIVLFQFKADASPEAIQEVCSSMVALKDKCLHPESQAPYIKSMSGGKDNSPENLQRSEDRDYYVAKDPAHQLFVKTAGQIIEKAIVVDYTIGVF